MSARVVTFGEVLVRLSPPGRGLLADARGLDLWVGGAEANVAASLAALGDEVALVSAVPPEDLGELAVRTLRGRGVDCRWICRRPGRMGLYFVTNGAGHRPTEVLYDRAGSAFATSGSGTWPWERILCDASWLHLSGIVPALGERGTEAAFEAVAAARSRGVRICFDGNYRPKLWAEWAGRPREILSRIVEQVDVLIGDHRDLSLLLGRPFTGDGEGRRTAALAAFDAYPRLTAIAGTMRCVEHVGSHRMSARFDTREAATETPETLLTDIVDRIGTGDAFAAGILHGLLHDRPPEALVREALALALLKHTVPGDFASLGGEAVRDLLAGGFDVRR